MSAYIVNDFHINALVTYGVQQKAQFWLAKEGRWVYFKEDTAPAIAAMLYSENVRSVNRRYSERTRRAGFVYRSVPIFWLRPEDIIKACDCLDYQSCECKDWERSNAKKALVSVRESAIEAMTKTAMTWELRQPEEVAA